MEIIRQKNPIQYLQSTSLRTMMPCVRCAECKISCFFEVSHEFVYKRRSVVSLDQEYSSSFFPYCRSLVWSSFPFHYVIGVSILLKISLRREPDYLYLPIDVSIFTRLLQNITICTRLCCLVSTCIFPQYL